MNIYGTGPPEHLDNYRSFLKNGEILINNAAMHRKDTDGIAINVDPDQTAPNGAV